MLPFGVKVVGAGFHARPRFLILVWVPLAAPATRQIEFRGRGGMETAPYEFTYIIFSLFELHFTESEIPI